MDIKELEQKRDKEMTGFFWLGLQIAFIFGIPASVAVWAGNTLNARFDSNFRMIFLVFSFIFSWVIVIVIYKKKAKRLKELDLAIKDLKEKNFTNHERI